MGRSRGGLTTKIHALVYANGNPILLKLTAGQAHDGRSARDMLGGLGTDQILLADRAYDSDALRASLAEQGAWANVKPMPRRVNIPAFRLYAFRGATDREDDMLTMDVVVGGAFDKQTPVFAADMTYLIFRPYWEVPASIMVDDQDKAIRFYTEILGFKKKHDIPVGEYRWNGPRAWSASQIVSALTPRSAEVMPDGPNRTAAYPLPAAQPANKPPILGRK
jgi:transposase